MHHLFIHCHSGFCSSCILDATLKEKEIKQPSQPKGLKVLAAKLPPFVPEGHMCKWPVRKWKEHDIVNFLPAFWVSKWFPSYESRGQSASIIHNPAVLRCPYLHLYCRTSKWLFPFLILRLPALSDFCCQKSRQSCSGAKSAHWWVAATQIYKQDL